MVKQAQFFRAIQREAELAKWKQDMVFRRSIIRLLDQIQRPAMAGGHMPIDTGTLQRSLRFFYRASTAINCDPDPYAYRSVADKINPEYRVSARWTAHYAKWQEHGYNHPIVGPVQGRHFVRYGIMDWLRICQIETNAVKRAWP